ncbi:MAG: hypothetical protein QNJ53_19220 [Pleurocapsa sp. MO_192.B19]|nr:hypothetical protein [Pleurocapsa sp. MO_192.B19]
MCQAASFQGIILTNKGETWRIHILREEDGFRCGLTQESLSHDDSQSICREHE